MRKQDSRPLTANCSLQGAVLNLSCDASYIVNQLQRSLEKKLGKNGVVLSWQDIPEGSEVRIGFVRIDQGNRFLRWLFPFIAPAVVEVEGELTIGGSGPRPFHYVRKAQVGFLGGSAESMLGVCASRVGNHIAKTILTMTG